jgi:glucose/arabinose dehydrogenase
VRPRILFLNLLAIATLGVGATPWVSAEAPPAIGLSQVATGLESPVAVAHAGDQSGRLFIVLQAGQIVIYDGSAVLATPFLDIRSLVGSGGERGLLSVAFHPSYEVNGNFFVNYTDTAGDTVVARYRVSADENVADPASAEIILQLDQPFANHNGGQLQLGPDDFLYIATGDGGSGGDPDNRAQNLQDLLGKILRIDIDGNPPYEIPADNPFVDTTARDEIWAFGLRNPWRFGFDRLTGDLFIADVGQNSIEEVNFQRANSTGGENYGWRLMEGSSCFDPPSGCNDGSLVLPVLEYDHTEGCSVTGGYRYRGTAVPQISGVYVFGDYCSGTIWGGMFDGNQWKSIELASTPFSISAFGESEAGELYLLDYAAGVLYRITSVPVCEVELDRSSYSDGELITASSLRFFNPSDAPVPVELKIWMGTPDDTPISVANFGARGAFSLRAGADIELGPQDLLTVTPALTRGPYEFSCRMLNPITGALLAEDRNPFVIE